MNSGALLAITLLPLAWALVARRLRSSPLTGPLVMAAAGVALGPQGLDVLALDVGAAEVAGPLTVALVVVLFSDAARLDLSTLRRSGRLAARLLVVGLPLGIVAGALAALGVMPSLTLAAAVVLAVAVVPTDAALGLAVVEDERVPPAVRQGLNVESGLNDGIAVPLFVLAVAGAAGELSTVPEAVTTFLTVIGVAVVTGGVVGAVGVRLLELSDRAGWSSASWRSVATVLLAPAAYALADVLGGSGFVAAFVAGMALAATARGPVEELTRGSEAVGHLLTLLAFLLFGAAVLSPALERITWPMLAFAVLALTLTRLVPVAIALLGARYSLPTVLFVGWFGPRGLASVIFAAELVDRAEFAQAEVVATAIITTVALSVVAHGVTAAPWARRYAAVARRHPGDAPEHEDVMVVRSGRTLPHSP
ncbi:Na+/H+ antiporter [Serinicoccus hydrothermalis]|uniref:Na+/H+ antiporter n=1 Tax=Serinicoccus hydrothermalis TaxID=1758689 RepID=A0A1B1NE12_9MICO|nr:cation:proton antiporter [Serinicoccus hydrothermalis]ANS79679.1 Na+/H+ antiporter [Serinicoccus hydrothermalis]